MRVQILESSIGPGRQSHFALSMIIDDVLCVDAGCIGFQESLDVQRRIRHILMTHAHMDHIASLPIFLENVYEESDDCVTVHALEEVLKTLSRDIFNDRVWPDFIALSRPGARFLNTVVLTTDERTRIGRHTVTPFEVDHGTPTVGYVIDDGDGAIIIGGDTAPTERLWQLANECPNLRAVFLECSFPNEQHQLARVSWHLTPQSFAREIEKLTPDVPIYPITIKSRFREQTLKELAALRSDRIRIPPVGRDFQP